MVLHEVIFDISSPAERSKLLYLHFHIYSIAQIGTTPAWRLQLLQILADQDVENKDRLNVSSCGQLQPTFNWGQGGSVEAG